MQSNLQLMGHVCSGSPSWAVSGFLDVLDDQHVGGSGPWAGGVGTGDPLGNTGTLGITDLGSKMSI